MSILWNYMILSHRHQALDARIIPECLRVVKAHGYEPAGLRPAGVDSLEDIMAAYPGENASVSEEEVVDKLSEQGGTVFVRKNNLEIWLGFDASDTADISVRNPNYSVDPLQYTETSLCVERYQLKDSAVAETQLAADLASIFADICVALDAPYGYCCDEIDWEELVFRKLLLSDFLSTNKPPEVLFWLQYISMDFIKPQVLRMFEEYGAKVEMLQKGALVRFFDDPLAVDLAELFEINNIWRKVRSMLK
jgi:hypothetical protein